MISPVDVLDTLINRHNLDPLTNNKFYYKYSETENTDKGMTLRLDIGSAEYNSSVFMQYLSEGDNKDVVKEQLYWNVINYLLGKIYDYFNDIKVYKSE
jgi:hypothetical protein